ncbi:PadR family transcriptional regulator [Dactylosporangium sp. NPDC000521]|uniref:PadR family transcriptional regulator n=1 Tax=Dactylosporangium sp. NPDC000521 TaxID=3363975 RepID=UPI0036983347
MTEQTYYVLTALLDGPRHGYAIIKQALELSGGRVRLPVGTLYGSLDRLADQDLIELDHEETVAGRPRRYFRLTDDGRQAVLAEAVRMQKAARLVLRHAAVRTATA